MFSAQRKCVLSICANYFLNFFNVFNPVDNLWIMLINVKLLTKEEVCFL